MHRRGESGQVLIIAALAQVVIIALIGFGVDYGVLLAQRAKLQNAADAASLAAAHSLVTGPSPGPTAAKATATQYLGLHGFTADATTTINYTILPSAAGRPNESIKIDITRKEPTFFMRVLGVSKVDVKASSVAEANRTMTDIMLSLDLTGSMEMMATADLPQLRSAVVQFINEFNLSTSDPRGTKIGIARFAGTMCTWIRTNGSLDTSLDLVSPSEYKTPCTDDKTVVSDLTQNKADLIKIADGTGGGSCPGGMSQYACPLQSWKFDQVQTEIPGVKAAPLSLREYGSVTVTSGSLGGLPHYTGTKLPNGISVVNNSASQTGWDANHSWSAARGGRPEARKILVLMTDGFNEVWPDVGNPSGSPGAWDAEVVARANTLKKGPDGVAGTADDVEIYTIGFFCVGSNKWCASSLANTAPPRPCPGGAMPGTASAIDNLLRNVSSSSPGSCDHYFPLRKTEDLPQLFTVLAGNIARGRLTS